MAGIAEALFGKENPFAQWANSNSARLGALGAGLASGTSLGGSFANAAMMMPQARMIDDERAYKAAESQKAEQQLNETIQFLQASAPDLAKLVEAGMPPQDAWAEAMRRQQPQEPQAPIKVGAGETLLDPQTMQPLYQGQPDQKEAFGFEKDLNSQYSSTDPVKTYQVVKSGYERVRQSANADTGAGDVGLIYGFMKMLDPGSVVREGEFAVAESTTGVPQQILSLYNKAIEGTRLSPEQRQQFVALADQLYQESAANLSSVNEQYSTRAQGWNVDPSRFLVQPEAFQPFASPAITDYKSKYGLE